jgi:hypothetical protein
MTKCCYRCKEIKSVDDFNRSKKYKDGRQNWCKTCSAAYRKQWYTNPDNKNKNRLNTKKNRAKRVDLVKKLKTQIGCINCGESDECTLDWHHLNNITKDSTISKLLGSGSNWEALVKELQKCVVLCANCHRKLHAGRFTLPK